MLTKALFLASAVTTALATKVCIQTADGANKNVPANCLVSGSASSYVISEDSIITFWTDEVKDWSTFLSGWKTRLDGHSTGVYLSANTGSRNTTTTPNPAPNIAAQMLNDPKSVVFSTCWLHAPNFVWLPDCVAMARVDSAPYDGPSAYQTYLGMHPNATSIPFAGAMIVNYDDESNANFGLTPPGYIRIGVPYAPETTPYNIAFFTESPVVETWNFTVVSRLDQSVQSYLTPTEASGYSAFVTSLEWLLPAAAEFKGPAIPDQPIVISGGGGGGGDSKSSDVPVRAGLAVGGFSILAVVTLLLGM
ncbi:hypothetical protein HKX48_006037 [Thoreauomyces humboldtii]|nr:hypothetical protein HKX48_006037 [Thoreauomyces humboldtii]